MLAVHVAHDRTARLRLAHFQFPFFALADLASVVVHVEAEFAVLATADGGAFDLPLSLPRLLLLIVIVLTPAYVASVRSFDEPVRTVHSTDRPIGAVDPSDGTLAYVAPVGVLLEPVGAVHPADRFECASVSCRRHNRRLWGDRSLRRGRLCAAADLASVLVPLESVGAVPVALGSPVTAIFRPVTLANVTTVFALLESELAVH